MVRTDRDPKLAGVDWRLEVFVGGGSGEKLMGGTDRDPKLAGVDWRLEVLVVGGRREKLMGLQMVGTDRVQNWLG